MKVFFEKVTDLDESVEKLFDLIGWKELIKEGDRVLIKPNYCANYENGVTTDMRLLQSVVDLARTRTENVFVGETDSTFKDHTNIMRSFPLQCEFLNLSEVKTFTHKGLRLPEIATESVVINIPVFKTHTLTGMTLGIKNLFGFIQDKNKSKYHHKIDSTLMDILEVIRPPINILDGIYSLDERGPTSGRIRQTGFLMASRDVVALDMAACEVGCVDLHQASHILKASKIYGTKPEFSTDFRIECEVPVRNKLDECTEYLQQNLVTRMLLENPAIRSIAKRVKNTLEGPKTPKY
ncbi:DUF362 domain-containing protein [archaeon]|nr:DUF362 domain-containing protein [archaeon]